MKKLYNLLLICLLAGAGLAHADTTIYKYKQFIGQDTSGERTVNVQLSAAGACTPAQMDFATYQATAPGMTLKINLINPNSNTISVAIDPASTGFSVPSSTCLGSVAGNSSCAYTIALGNSAGQKQFIFKTNEGANTCQVVAN